MRAITQFLAVVVWFLIWLPTSLFVVAVMFKSIFGTERGRLLGLAMLIAVPVLVGAIKMTGGNGRNAE